jgi:hypothetical protein
VLLVSLFLGTKALALTLESQCQRISIKTEKAEISTIDPESCTGTKIFKKPGTIFYRPSIHLNEYIVLKRHLDDAFFCKMPFDYLGFYDAVKGIEKNTWNSKKSFTSLVRMTHEGGVIRSNAKESKAKKIKLCSAFPSFIKARVVPSGVMSESLKSLKKGGYMMVSSRFSSLYFFGMDLKKVEFVFNLPNDVQVVDAIARKNGELIILSSHGDELTDEKKELCIDRWDLITGSMIMTRCGLKHYDQQILVDRDKPTRAYIKNKILYFEEFDKSLESKTVPIIKNTGAFNLNSAFVYEN